MTTKLIGLLHRISISIEWFEILMFLSSSKFTLAEICGAYRPARDALSRPSPAPVRTTSGSSKVSREK